MKVLIVGGTSFVGRAMAHAALGRGDEVTVFNRGVTPHDLPDQVERLVGDRRADLSALAGRSFDATIDSTAYRPSDVDALATALNGHGGFHLQISSISAYRDPDAPGATEETAVTWDDEGLDPDAPITNETYGPLKAASERAALARFGADVALVRPTYVIGAFDATLRFPYWVARARRGGVVAVPGPRESAMQYIDARDLADFALGLVASRTTGAFHVAGPFPATRFVDLVERVVERAAPAGARVEIVEAQRVAASDLADRFPLWSGGGSETALAVDPAKAIAHGLSLRPLEDSVDDVVAWWGDRAWPAQWLTEEQERSLLA